MVEGSILGIQARSRKARRCNEDEGCDKGDWRRKIGKTKMAAQATKTAASVAKVVCFGSRHKASLKLKNAYAARASNKGKRDATNGRVALPIAGRQQQGDAECVIGNRSISSTWPESLLSVSFMKCMTHRRRKELQRSSTQGRSARSIGNPDHSTCCA